MESDKSNKLTKQQIKIINDLYSSDINTILQSIETLREEGGEYSIIPLMDVFFTTPYSEVQKAVGDLICSVKDNKISDIITQNLSKYSNNEHIGFFLSNLWQSSLKFNDLDVFLDMFINGDDKTALEAFTVIEQNIENISVETMNEINKKVDDLNDFKRNLIIDILNQ